MDNVDDVISVHKDGLYLVAARFDSKDRADAQAMVYKNNGRAVEVREDPEHGWSIWSPNDPDHLGVDDFNF